MKYYYIVWERQVTQEYKLKYRCSRRKIVIGKPTTFYRTGGSEPYGNIECWKWDYYWKLVTKTQIDKEPGEWTETQQWGVMSQKEVLRQFVDDVAF